VSAPSEATHRWRWMELLATVLLALATVATAWASYQSRQWTGEATLAAGRANAARVESARATGTANQLTGIDVATFIQWVDATAHKDAALATFYRARFRPEFRPAFDAWLATDPFTNTSAPPSPFAMSQYRLAANVKADELARDAAANTAGAVVANERANDYVGAVVLFASALFFAGISTKLTGTGARLTILGLGCAVFLGTGIWLATQPLA
jgi:hypothetical protein